MERIVGIDPEFTSLMVSFQRGGSHLGRIVDNNLVAILRFEPSGSTDNLVDALEILSATGRSCKHQRERNVPVIRMQQNAQNIENLLGGTSAAGKDHNTVPGTHESLEALFDVGHDHQLVDDWVGRFGGDDARLTDTQIPAVVHSLVGVANGG